MNQEVSNQCPICVENYNFGARMKIECTKCDFICCKTCFKRFITDPEHYLQCMNCHITFDRTSLYSRLGRTFMQTSYRNIRETVLFEQEKALFPATQEIIERKNKITKLQKDRENLDQKYDNLRKKRTEPLLTFRQSNEVMKVRDALDLYNILKSNIEIIDVQLADERENIDNEIESLRRGGNGQLKRTYILACATPNCKGMLSKENININGHYICELCNATTCDKCKMETTNNDNHICDPDILKTVQFMENTSKPCPSCGIPIHKISGCFAAGTIISLMDGTNAFAHEIEKDNKLIGDDNTERTVLSTTTGTDQLYMIKQSNGCDYEVNTYHTLCLMREDHTIILMTLIVYLNLPDEEKKKLFGYKIIDNEIVLSKLSVEKTRIGRYYGFLTTDNQRFCLTDGTVVHNCSQMFCTSCHASFDWRTMQLNKGTIHNPHHIAWLRENKNRSREISDIPCGRELTMDVALDLEDDFIDAIELAKEDSNSNEFVTKRNYLVEAIRYAIHHNRITLPGLNRNIDNHQINQQYRIRLLSNLISETEFKREIQIRDKASSKKNELLQIVQTYRDAIIDLIWEFVETRHQLMEWISLIDNIYELEKYINGCFEIVAQTYGTTNAYKIMDDRAIR